MALNPPLRRSPRAAQASRPAVRIAVDAPRSAVRLSEPLGVAVVVLAAVGIPLLVAIATGAISVPHNDDWAFYRIAATLVDSGELTLLNWNEMTLIGHLAWGAPFLLVFGTSVSAVHLAGAAAAVLSLVGAYAVYRRFLEPRLALFGVAVLGAFPVFAMLSTSYMTDLTALAPQLICIALGLAALDASGPRRAWLLALALGVGFVGFSTREVAIAAPLAVIGAHAIATRRQGQGAATLAWSTAGFLVACAAFYLWRQGLAAGGSPVVAQGSARDLISNSVSAFFTVALGALPALALGARTVLAALRQPLGRAVAGTTLLLGVVKIIAGASPASASLLLGGYISQWTITSGNQLGSAPTVLPEPVWWVVVAAALIAGSCLSGFLAVRAGNAIAVFRTRGLAGFEPSSLMIVLFGCLAAAPLVGRLVVGGAIYDRYLLAPLAVVLLLVLRWVRLDAAVRVARTRAAVALGLSALLTFVFVVELRALERGRWDAGMSLVNAGFSPRQVDAGLEWVGLNYPGVPGEAGPARWQPPDAFYFEEAFSRYSNCVAISTSRRDQPWMDQIGIERYSTLFGLRDREFYLYRNQRAC